jgi:hypothetical protein
MQTLSTRNYAAFDCNAEFSVQNLLHVRKLVEEADISDADEEFAFSVETDRLPKKSVSEVKPPTAYQHLAGNVV